MELPDFTCTHCGRTYYAGEKECKADDCPGLPLYLITRVEYITNYDSSVVSHGYEMVYPNAENKLYRGISAQELFEWQITAMGIERFESILFEDEISEQLQLRYLDDEDYLSYEEQRAMILSEYQSRGLIEFRDEDVVLRWVKEVTEGQYAIYKECVRSPVNQILSSDIGKDITDIGKDRTETNYAK